MQLDGNNRVAFVQYADKNFVPTFIGKHRSYDSYLKKPDLDPSTKIIKMDIPEQLSTKGVLGKTSFSIGNIKLRGVVGGIISSGVVLALGGTPKEAVAATTPGHVGVELAEGDIKGATEALVVDGTGDVGCVAGGVVGAKVGAALGAWAAGWVAIPGGIIGGIAGCIGGGVLASATEQAIWNKAFEDEAPQQILEELKKHGLDQVPNEIVPDMPQDIRELVTYKQKVVNAVDNLNAAGAALTLDPKNKELQDNFAEAGKLFKESADAYNISVASMDDPAALTQYIQENDRVISEQAVLLIPGQVHSGANAAL